MKKGSKPRSPQVQTVILLVAGGYLVIDGLIGMFRGRFAYIGFTWEGWAGRLANLVWCVLGILALYCIRDVWRENRKV